MGSSPGTEPVVFLKPNTSLKYMPSSIELPSFSSDVHHEVELVCQIAKDVWQVNKEDAGEYIYGYGIGIDLTARDIQSKAKSEGKPWTLAKGFFGSAPISQIMPKEKFKSNTFEIELKVNNETRQKGSTDNMIWQVGELLEYLSHRFKLNAGDIIFTGTPEGVGRLNSGDSLQAYLNEKKLLDFLVK